MEIPTLKNLQETIDLINLKLPARAESGLGRGSRVIASSGGAI
jgi:hypothetical protein